MSQKAYWREYVAKTLLRSPLFFHLDQQMRHDPEIIRFLDLIEDHQPPQILLFATVMYLLLSQQERERDYKLARFYPYFCEHPWPPEEAYPSFKAFCLEHAQELKEILPIVRLQTNEPLRCFPLLFAFDLVARRTGLPLAMIEVGASLGLNLNWHRYGYSYGAWQVGDHSSPVQLCAQIESEHLPPFPQALPEIASVQGIELFPLDVMSEVDVAWIKACIWPEERDRYPRLDAAIRLAHQYLPLIHHGDACEVLPDLLAQIPAEQSLCLWHSFALNQGPVEVKEEVERIVANASQNRSVYRVSLEVDRQAQPGTFPRLELFTYQHGILAQREVLAHCSLHGEMMEWLLPVTAL